jgi:hypothetical protein
MNGTLEIGPNSSGLTSLTGNATNWLELRGSISALNAALDGLQYTPDAGTTSDFLDASIDDLNTIGGDAKTTLLGTNIVVSTFPESGLNFGISGYGQESASESTGLTFSAANGNPITVYGTDNITQPLTAYLQVLNGTLTVTNTSAAVTIAANGTSLISVTGTTDAIDQTLDGLVYQPTGNASSDIIEGFMTAPEGTNLFAPQEWAPITINPGADDLPLVIGIPGPQTVAAGSELTFSHGGGGIVRNGDNALSVADGDANGSTETVFLQVLYGTLAVGNTAGLGSASGNGTSLLILSGTVPNLNAALDGLRYLYAPPADSPSGDGSINSDYLSILISDNAPVTYNSASAGVQISIT